MSLASPLWLIALLPWAGIVVWLLTGRREPAAVPFLELWRGPVRGPRVRAALHRPPLAVICGMLAMLLAILAAARPIVHFLPYQTGPKLTVIVDRGLTMSARAGSDSRWKQLVQDVRRPLLHVFGVGPTEVLLIPEGTTIQSDRLGWFVEVNQSQPPPVDTRKLVPAAVQKALRSSDGPVIVLSDQALGVEDRRLYQVAPPGSPRNVGIEQLAASTSPRPQLMVGIRNDSELPSATLKITTEAGTIAQSFDLPPRGTSSNRFVDVERIAAETVVELVVDDELSLDNRVSLVRRQSWPRVEAIGDLPEPVRRMIEVYAKVRPPDEGSQVVSVTAEPSPEGPAAIVAEPQESAQLSSIASEVHPVTQNVRWDALQQGRTGLAAATGAGWQPVLTAGARPLVAIREAGHRQVWIGFASDGLARTSDWVVFWTNMLDWLGEGGEVFEPRGTLAVPMPAPISSDWQAKLEATPSSRRVGVSMAPALLCSGVGLILACVWLWGRTRP